MRWQESLPSESSLSYEFQGKNPGYYKEYYQKKIKGRPKPPDNSETD